MSYTLEQAFEHCREITRERARNFYYGLRLTPEPRRSALYSIYAWSRLGDDITDQDLPIDQRRAQLDAFRALTERALAGLPDTSDPIWIALSDTMARYAVAPVWFLQMLDGFEHDLCHKPFEHDDDLWVYCDQVAGTVGRMCLMVWGLSPGVDRENALELASLRGRAFQLTNILRDFAEDYDEGRVYLPRQRLDAHGLSASDVRTWSDHQACRQCVGELASAAREAFAGSAALEIMVAPDCRAVLWAMSEIYQGILEQIERRPEQVVAGRASLSGWRKASIAARAAVLGQWWQSVGSGASITDDNTTTNNDSSRAKA